MFVFNRREERMMFENIDNRIRLLGDDLKKELKENSKIRIAASCFSMYAFKELKEEFKKIDELKFLFTSPTFTKEKIVEDMKSEKREFYIPKLNRENCLYGTDFEIRLRNEMTLKAVARECAEWVKEKVRFKSNITESYIPNFIGIEKSQQPSIVYNPIDGFTASDLGYQQGRAIFSATMKTDFAEQSKFLLSMFDEVWNDKSRVEDITDSVIEMISSAYQENSPEFIYYIVLYNVFADFLDEISDDHMPNEATGFKNTKIWNTLYDFQKNGAISIIQKLEKHNGCVLADSVGLGKTFTALAVMAYYSLRNKSILVLCPKRLGQNWMQYCGNEVTNIFYQDRIRYDVLYHTDLGRSGMSHDGRDIKYINWGNYDLVVLDESHNFRNNYAAEGKESRYNFLVNKVLRPGVKTKILMLSATPVNNRYADLKNQLALAYAQDYDAFEASLDTKSSIASIFRNAQSVFNEWSRKPIYKRKTIDLVNNLSMDFKTLLDSVTIARSRKKILKYYKDNSIGNFPERLPPQSYFPELTELQGVSSYEEIYEKIALMNMAVYGVFDYVLESKKEKYEMKTTLEENFGGISRGGRTAGIKRLMTINLLKRLESSVEAFSLTMDKILKQNLAELDRLQQYEDGLLDPDATIDKKVFSYEAIDMDDETFSLFRTDKGRTISIKYADVDRRSWKRAMQEDVNELTLLLNEMNKITTEHDNKLQTLKDVIKDKIQNPINPGNHKVLIFSAFADTANYLYDNLKNWLKENYGIESALIVGQKNRTTISDCSNRTDALLTMFSPISKNRDETFNRIECHGKSTEIDILIATDCISEGQNLQDCDMCLNYDIHWNPVRIVQRYGRVDRLGSKNEKIRLINFWPPISLNEYLNLTERVSSRMTIVNQTATADDNILDPDEQLDDYREIQIKKLQEGENIDLDDQETGVSISDLGLNDFRMDMSELLKTYGKSKQLPKGLHCVVPADEKNGIAPGVIYVLKNQNQNLSLVKRNRLYPYFLVYVDKSGKVIEDYTQVHQILEILKRACSGRKEPIAEVYKKFNLETDDGKDMHIYSGLLKDAIQSMISEKNTSDLQYLFKFGSEVLNEVGIKGLDDFELITFVVIEQKEGENV